MKKEKFITIGEIMLRLTPPDYEKIRTANTFEARYGGSEANVALSLANLGIDASFFTIVPDNSLGKSCKEMILKCLNLAKEKGMTVSFDENFRSTFWDWEEARDFCTMFL